MSKGISLVICLFISFRAYPQQMDSVINVVRYPQEMNIAYSQLYVLNSDIGDISFFDQGHPDKRQYILNTNIIPNFYITPRKWRFNIVLTPVVRARIIANQKSLPVRTPSFNPGGQIYFPIDRTKLTDYKYLSIGYYHHSNGQDGSPLDSLGNPNLYNGNFVTNYLIANYHLGKITTKQNNYLRLGLELHSGLVKTGDEPAYRDLFGKLRVNYHYAYTRFARIVNKRTRNAVPQSSEITEEEKYRLVISGMFIVDNITAKWNQYFNVEVKYYRKIQGSENAAFFGSVGYMGHDYYNVYFYQPYPFVRIGIAASNAFLYNQRFRNQQRKVERINSTL
ncbi:MAG: hypothetical protein EOO00_00755 [Chitinophagaceae bacterium]|nr:MAG: hypothetical protein EOO00_00755 [Chitinophagaceae bacterium]